MIDRDALELHLRAPTARDAEWPSRAISDRPLPAAMVAAQLGMGADAEEIAEALDLFVDKGLVMRDADLYLALAIPERPRAQGA